MRGALRRACARLIGVHRQVRQDGLDELLADGVERVQRGQWILKDRANLAATDGAHLRVGQVVDTLAFEQDFAAGDAARRLQQADDGRAGERLAGARLADDAKDFAGRNLEGDVVQRQERAMARGELHPQVAHFKQGCSHFRR